MRVCVHCFSIAFVHRKDPLATHRSKAVVLVHFLLDVFGVDVSCGNLYSFVVYLYVNDIIFVNV